MKPFVSSFVTKLHVDPAVTVGVALRLLIYLHLSPFALSIGPRVQSSSRSPWTCILFFYLFLWRCDLISRTRTNTLIPPLPAQLSCVQLQGSGGPWDDLFLNFLVAVCSHCTGCCAKRNSPLCLAFFWICPREVISGHQPWLVCCLVSSSTQGVIKGRACTLVEVHMLALAV